MMALYAETNPVAIVNLDKFVLSTSPEVPQVEITSPDPFCHTTNTESPVPTTVNSSSELDNPILPIDPTRELLTPNTSATLTPFNTLSTPPNLPSESYLASLKSTPSSLPTSHGQTTPPLLLNNPTSAIYEDTYKESTSIENYAKKLVFKLFEKDELMGSNCAGVKGKRPLEEDHRMQLVKDVRLLIVP